ncbi:thiamine phosphate synthase [Lishizhenia sp.]|uniref:thiamine phosphate synthase n=1 Tax=Lishizhenia sp. TaxID=2497594 RepID=UPI00299E17DA|nr:thiamine phosphate synthase [Lishizhenia sp.]MDX1444768.1 thiamine phosphate synthase [Lishizhenia sp.]
MLVLFTPEQDHPQEMEIVCALFEAGLERLHLRKPGATKNDYKAYLNAIPTEHLHRVYIHQYHDLKEEFPTIHLHLRNQDLPNEHFKAKTTGAHSVEEALEKLKSFEEVYLSPVFPSISKDGYKRKENLSIQHLDTNLRQRIIALGGIHPENLSNAKEFGFHHFAVLGCIWQSAHPLQSFKQLQNTL